MSTIRENRLFLGNPGTGKSTLINCLLGGNHMQSGLSWGGGLSKDYHRFEKDGVVYMDAPGLADETIQLQAAQAITKALKQSGKYKLFFLVRLQNGRVVSEDLVTLERVLDSIDAGDLSYKFTIVINCLGERQYKALAECGDEFKTIKTLINRRYLTESFCFIPRIEALEEKSDAVVELPQGVRDFLDNEAPVIAVEERQVKPITLTGFAQQSQAIKSEIEKLRNDQSALLRTMREQEKRHDEAMKRMRASHAAELDRLSKGMHPTMASALSPRGNHDYRALPLTPPVGREQLDETPSAWLGRRKRLAILIVVVVIAIAVIVGVVIATQSKRQSPTPTPSTPTPTAVSTPTPTSAPNLPPSPTLEPTPAPTPAPAPTPTPTAQRWAEVGCVTLTKPLSDLNKTISSRGNLEEGWRFAVASGKKYFTFRSDNLVIALNIQLQEPVNNPGCVPQAPLNWFLFKVTSV